MAQFFYPLSPTIIFCNICGKEYKKEKSMKLHLEHSHRIFVSEKYIKNPDNNGEVSYKCKICSRNILFCNH